MKALFRISVFIGVFSISYIIQDWISWRYGSGGSRVLCMAGKIQKKLGYEWFDGPLTNSLYIFYGRYR